MEAIIYDSFFIDYIAFGTDRLTNWIENQLLTAYKITSNRFYKVHNECIGATVQTCRRIENLNKISVRAKKEYINDCIFSGLPIDCKVQRIDFAINTKTEEEAKKYVIGKQTMFFSSDTGVTFYYGNREGAFFERVYYLNERGCWRYELEFKPRAGRKNNKLNKASKEILKLWHEVCSMMTEIGRICPDELTQISESRKFWIDTHIESDFVPPTKDFYNSLKSDLEKQYFINRLRHTENKARQFLWSLKIDF